MSRATGNLSECNSRPHVKKPYIAPSSFHITPGGRLVIANTQTAFPHMRPNRALANQLSPVKRTSLNTMQKCHMRLSSLTVCPIVMSCQSALFVNIHHAPRGLARSWERSALFRCHLRTGQVVSTCVHRACIRVLCREEPRA